MSRKQLTCLNTNFQLCAGLRSDMFTLFLSFLTLLSISLCFPPSMVPFKSVYLHQPRTGQQNGHFCCSSLDFRQGNSISSAGFIFCSLISSPTLRPHFRDLCSLLKTEPTNSPMKFCVDIFCKNKLLHGPCCMWGRGRGRVLLAHLETFSRSTIKLLVRDLGRIYIQNMHFHCFAVPLLLGSPVEVHLCFSFDP